MKISMQHAPTALTMMLVFCTSCAVDTEQTVATNCPPAETFADVSPVLEDRCGTLDCHGALSRPLRVYGTTGMRLIEDLDVLRDPDAALTGGVYPNGAPTTGAELNASRGSLCALEPELMRDVQQGNADASELMVLRKPSGGERHKGGVLFAAGDAADDCIRGWLSGTNDQAACAAALP